MNEEVKVVSEQTTTVKNIKVDVHDMNGFAMSFLAIGVLIIISAFVGGMIIGQDQDSYSKEVDFSVAINYWIGGFIFGMVFIGFGKVIDLLDQINNKLSHRG